MKNTTLAAVIGLAATMTASAQYGGGYTCEKDSPFYASLAGGYMFEFDEPYGVANFGYQFSDCSTSLSLQVLYSEKNTEFDVLNTKVDFDESYTGLGLSLSSYKQIDSAGGVYFAAGAGVMFVDAELSAAGESIDGDDESLYIDATFGVRRQFTEYLSGHIGARFLWLDDFEINAEGVKIFGPQDDFYYGLEAGLTFRF